MNLKPKKGLAWRRVAGELFIVDAAGSRMHELNGPAAVVWEALAAGRGETGAAEALTASFEIDAGTARKDCVNFIKELSAAGLLD